MSGGGARAGEVAGDHRLAMSRRERVQRPPAERRREQDQDQQAVRVTARQGRREAVPGAVGRRLTAADPVGRAHRPRARRNLEARRSLVEWALEQLAWVGAQSVGRILGRDARDDGGSLARERANRAPADASVEGLVGDLDPRGPGRDRGGEARLEPGEVEPRLPGRERELDLPGLPEADGPAVDGELEARGRVGDQLARQRRPLTAGERPVPVGVEALDLLERRDLGLVEDVVDRRRALVEPQLDQLVRREVPERVGVSRCGAERGQRRDGERPCEDGSPGAHPSASSARSARGP